MIIHEDLVEANSRLLGNPDDDGDDELAWALGVYFGVALIARDIFWGVSRTD